MVRDLRRLRRARARTEREREQRDDRVARAAHVEDFARPRRRVVGRGVVAEQQHAVLAERDEQIFRVPFFQKHAPDFEQRGVGGRRLDRLARRQTRAGKGFRAVRLDDGHALPGERVVRIRIDGDDFPRAPRPLANRRGELRREQPFAVILDDDGVDFRQQRVELRERGGGVLGMQALLFFAVDPHHMLLPRDDARLHDRLVARMRLHRAHVDALAREQPSQPLRVQARAGHAHDAHALGKLREIACHVGRAAGEEFFLHDLDHRHRGLRRNARDFAPQKLVEHEVADDEQALGGKGGEELGDAIFGHGEVKIRNPNVEIRNKFKTSAKGKMAWWTLHPIFQISCL